MEPSKDVLKFFAAMQQAGAPPLMDIPIEQARFAYRQKSEIFGGPVVEMAGVEDIAAEGPRGAIPLRHYRPHGLPPGPGPLLIYIHGGGWVMGDLDSHDTLCRQLAHRAGCAVIAVDYRLAPEHPAPASSDDVIAAFWWIVANASALDVDAERIAVGGDSAGGGLGAVVAIAARDADFPLSCQILIYPATDNRDTAWDYPSRIRFADMPPLPAKSMKYLLDFYLTDRSLASDWRISPLLAEDVQGLCPALLIMAGCDLLYDEGRSYADRLERSGVDVTRRTFPGMIHGFIELGGILPETSEALDMIGATLRQRLNASI